MTDSTTDATAFPPLPVVGVEAIDAPAFTRIRKNGYSWQQVDAWVSDVIEVLEQLTTVKASLEGGLASLRSAARNPGAASSPVTVVVPNPLPTIEEPEFSVARKNGYNPHEVNTWAMEAVKRCTDMTRDIEWSERETEMLKAQIPSVAGGAPVFTMPAPSFEPVTADVPVSPGEEDVTAPESSAPPALDWDAPAPPAAWAPPAMPAASPTPPPVAATPPAMPMGPPSGPPTARPPVTTATPSMMPHGVDGHGDSPERYVIENARAEARKILDDAKHRANKIVRDVAVRTTEIRVQREAQIEADMEQARSQVQEIESIVIRQRTILAEASQRFQAWREWAVSEMERAANEFRLTPDPFADPLYGLPGEVVTIEEGLEDEELRDALAAAYNEADLADEQLAASPDAFGWISAQAEVSDSAESPVQAADATPAGEHTNE